MRLLAAVAILLAMLPPVRAEPVDVSFESAQIDLLPLSQAIQSLAPRTTVELPAAGDAPAQTLELNARGPGLLHRWAVFTLHNPDPFPRDLVVAAPHQRFVASGVLWPLPEGSRVLGLVAADGRQIAPIPSAGADAFALTIPPGAIASYVLEVSATGLDRLSLWHRDAFHVVADRYAFFRGLVLGIAILLGVSFICLFIVRPQAVFPAAALFAWSAIAFLVIEMGYLPTVVARVPALAGNEQGLRALTEGLMLAGVIAMLGSFLELRRRMPKIGFTLLAGGAAAVALALYGLLDPRHALGLIRIAFAVMVAGGLGLMVLLWQRGSARAHASLLGWVVLTAWTVAAGIGALGILNAELMHPLVSAGLVLVLVTTGFTLAQFAFGLGAASGAASEEAGRRALALAASDQAVWDWQVDQGRLYVGPELDRALGLEEGTCCDAAAWLDLIHPADRAAYGAAVEEAEQRGRGSFSQEFRLRRADGGWRWYVLRARAVPGGSGGASRLIGTLADVTVIRRSEDRLLADAVRDRLTGLPNRALFLDRLEQAMSRERDWAGAALYVIALDLDRFKSFNDGLGDEAGDHLLNTTGRRLLACVGPADTVARLPGNQFGIIWDASHHDIAITELTTAIGLAVAQPIYLPAGEVVITASMGVTPVHNEFRGADAVLKDAEIALYEAKRKGYGAVEYFRPEMHEERSQLLQLEQNLRLALERNEIEVDYQPIVRLSDRKLAGFEALMRWRRSDGVLDPDSFIGVAEETGLIRELGSYVLKEAISRLGIWQRTFRPHEPLFVSVNISSAQLLNSDLVDDVQRLIEREELQPASLKLELTESLVVENLELAHKLLTRLKQMGVALACDDFGTGYSGLESLFRLPFDTVKIDRIFLEDESGERNWMMIAAMLRLARDLGLEVVAEGIESDEQMERLSGLGCDYGQGFFIGPPVSAQQVVEALGGHSYRAKGSEMGLATFWTRLTGRRAAESEAAAVEGRPRLEAAAAAPMPMADVAIETEIDARRVPSGKPRPAQAPRAGSAPFAPRPARARAIEPAPPDVEPPNVEPPNLELPNVEPEDAEPPKTDSPQPEVPTFEPAESVQPEEAMAHEMEPVTADAALAPEPQAPDATPQTRREKRKAARAKAGSATGRKSRRAAKASTKAAKSKPKGPKVRRSAVKDAPAKQQ